MQHEDFDRLLSTNELIAWDSIKAVIENFLGKNRSPHYRIFVEELLDSFETIGVHMSTKIHFLHAHMDFFEKQLATESDEQGERFHQTCLPMEQRYKSKSIHSMIADLCWSLLDNEIDMPRARK